jgi:hypothetical protein
VTDRSQTMTPFIKVIIATDEEAFLELPPILNAYLKPAIMQLNTDETAVELFFLQPEDARALVAALGKLTPSIGAEILAESVVIPIGRAMPLTHPLPHRRAGEGAGNQSLTARRGRDRQSQCRPD